jgi:hypothetical protein
LLAHEPRSKKPAVHKPPRAHSLHRARREAAGKHALAVQTQILNEIESQTQAYSMALSALERAHEQVAASEALANLARRALTINAEDRPTTLAAEVTADTERLAELDAIEHAQLALGHLEDALRTPLFGPETTLLRQALSASLPQSP